MTRSKPATLHAAITSGSALLTLGARLARGQRAHVDVRVLDRVHADAVAEQRAARLAPRRIDRDDRDLELVVLVEAEAADQLVGERGLARAAGAGDAEHRRLRRFRRAQQLVAQLRRQRFGSRAPVMKRASALLRSCVSPACSAVRSFGSSCARSTSQRATISSIMPCRPSRAGRPRASRCASRRSPAARRSPSGTITPPPPPNTLMFAAAALAQQVEHVLEELDVAALVGRDRDARARLPAARR